jgi:hypothetical protein
MLDGIEPYRSRRPCADAGDLRRPPRLK